MTGGILPELGSDMNCIQLSSVFSESGLLSSSQLLSAQIKGLATWVKCANIKFQFMISEFRPAGKTPLVINN